MAMMGYLNTKPMYGIKNNMMYIMHNKWRCKDCGKEKLLPKSFDSMPCGMPGLPFNTYHCNDGACKAKPIPFDEMVSRRDGWGTLEQVKGDWISLTEEIKEVGSGEGVVIKNMPKLESPFVREEINGQYVCVPKIRDEYRWVFTKQALAVDKLDGTNVSLIIKNTKIQHIFNRMNYVEVFGKGNQRFVNGIYNAIDRGYLNGIISGQYFGELIGEGINGNPYKLQGQLWVPFYHLRKNYYYKFWYEFIKELEGKTDEGIFNQVSELFKTLWSLYKRSKKIGDVKEVNVETKFKNSAAAEGIVFYNLGQQESLDKLDNAPYSVCKIRRDQFDWYKGDRHKENADS